LCVVSFYEKFSMYALHTHLTNKMVNTFNYTYKPLVTRVTPLKSQVFCLKENIKAQ